MVIAMQDRFKLIDARDWPKRRDNENQEDWDKVNNDA